MEKRAVIILSGGIDSTTLCYKCLNEGYLVYPIIFDYGQRHLKEICYAKKTCDTLGLEYKLTDISNINELLAGSALTDPKIDVPIIDQETQRYETLQATIVPNRNSIFLAIAIGYAVSRKINNVFFGAHHSDRGVYPDCRKEFVEVFEKSQRLANDNEKLNVVAPFVESTKAQIVKLGSKLGVPFKNTWSCYRGEEIHCGSCSSCIERKKAFEEASVTDPTIYRE